MKLQSVSVLRWNNDTEEPVILDAAYNLAEYSFFTKGSVKEFLAFATKTVMKRIGAGTQGVDYEGNMVYCFVMPDGLGVIVVTDKEYPARVAITMAKELLADFKALHG
jgi:synaptobrevin family protein YKT6